MVRPSVIAALALVAGLVTSAFADGTRTIHVASSYPLAPRLFSEATNGVSKRVADLTDGALTLVFHEPGVLAPAADTLDRLSAGKISAAWATAGQLADKDTAFEILSAIPFGPDTNEYLAWLYEGGGLDISRRLFAEHGLHNIPCMVFPPEGAGWFRKEVRTVDDLRGLKVRYFGLGGRVLAKLGADVRQMPAGEIVNAMRRGDIDGAEYSLPSMDLSIGLQETARYYYFPGWHQQSTLYELYFHLDVWDSLTEKEREVVTTACGVAMQEGIARAEAMQAKALRQIRKGGVKLRRWSPRLLLAFEAAWDAVATEQKKENSRFREVLDSYQRFHRDYLFWKRFSYLH